MTPEAAIQSFLAGFGLPAYAATATPHDAQFPYLTYDLVIGGWDGFEVNMPVNIWYRTDSEAEPNAKVRQIASALGIGGVTVACEGGMLWLKKGSPWAQAIREEGDDKVRRRYLNVIVEYLLTE